MIALLAGPWGPVVIFVMRVVDVSMGTMRFLLVAKGQRTPAAILGFFEIMVWITAAGAVIQNLSSPLHVVGYAGGFAIGTWAGSWLEERLALGTSTVQAFSRDRNNRVAEALREMGHGVTEVEGEGLDGTVDIVHTVVRRQAVPRVIEIIEAADPDAFVTVADARARRGWMPRVRK